MKRKKVVVTMTSLLASVVLATGCAQKSENSSKEENKNSDNKITLSYDELRSRENSVVSKCCRSRCTISTRL